MTETAPKYIQVRDLLIHEIMAGRVLDGEKLPPEREMAEELGLSVGTLRKALEALEERGLLERRQGSGNYVKAGDDVSGLYAFFRLELARGGGLPTAQVLNVDRMPKPKTLPRLSEAQHAHRIRRLRLLDGIPAALEEIWLDGSYADHIGPEDLSDSLYQLYKTRLGLWITRAEDRTSLAPAPDWATPLTAPGTPCGYVERISWDQNGARAEASYTWFDPAVARYVQRIK